MSSLWLDMALARAAWAKAEEAALVDEGKVKPLQAVGPKAASRPARRVLHHSIGSHAL